MNGITTQDNLFASLGIAASDPQVRGTNKTNELGLNTFLKLMVTQLNNQDPFKPMENGDFLGQIAQFGSVTGLEQLNKNFESLATSITSGRRRSSTASSPVPRKPENVCFRTTSPRSAKIPWTGVVPGATAATVQGMRPVACASPSPSRSPLPKTMP